MSFCSSKNGTYIRTRLVTPQQKKRVMNKTGYNHPLFILKGVRPDTEIGSRPYSSQTTPNLILTRGQNARGLCKAWASTFANLRPHRRTKQGRRKEGPPFGPTTTWVYPPSATICILPPLFRLFSPTSVRSIPTLDHSPPLKSHSPRHRTAEHPRQSIIHTASFQDLQNYAANNPHTNKPGPVRGVYLTAQQQQ